MSGLSRFFALERIRRSVATLVVTTLLTTLGIPYAAANEVMPQQEAPALPSPEELPGLLPGKPKPLPAQAHTGEIIVRYKADPAPESLQSIGANVERAEGLLQVIRPLQADGVEATLAALRADPNVEFAELNYLFRAAATSDPLSTEQWANEEVAAGWGWAKGASLLGSIDQAAPVTVAVVDTGVDTAHADLVGRLLPGQNVITGAPDPTDVNDDATDGHGTHIAGLIAAATENGVGIAGLAGPFPVSVLPIKALDADGFGSMLDIAAGIRAAADQGASVINLSFGSRLPDYPITLAEAVKYAQDRGALVVAAAGNEGGKVAGYYPASLPGVVAVAATGRDHRPAVFTNKADVKAPGVDVLSTLPGDQYGALSGTSVSAAVVSGVAAVLRSVFPAKSSTEVTEALKKGHAPYTDRNTQYKVLSMTLALDALNGGQATPNSITFIQPTDMRVHGTTQFVAQMKEAADVDYVQFRLEDRSHASQLLGTLQGALESGTFELTWDSTVVPDGGYTIYAEAFNMNNVLLASGHYSFMVYNAASSGLTLQVIKPDGEPAAGASVTVYYAKTESGPLQTLFQGNADLQGNLVISGAQATDGNQFLVVAQGSDPNFLYSRAVTAPANVRLDAEGAYPVTIQGQDASGGPAVGATVWAGLIAGPNFPAVSGTAPLATLDGDGMATAMVSQGLYTWRQFSQDFAEYQVLREVEVAEATTVTIAPPTGGLATLEAQPTTGIFTTYGATWLDGDGFELKGPKGSSISVTPGDYSATIHAESPGTYFDFYYDVTVPAFTVEPGETRSISFGGPLQMRLSADRSGQVSVGSSVTFAAEVTDAGGNRLRNSQPSLYVTYNGYTSSVGWPTWQISPYSTPGTYSLHAEWSAGPLGLVKSEPISFEVVGGATSAPLTVNLIGKSGAPIYGQVYLMTKSPGGYVQVTAASINNGVASFPSSSFDPNRENAVILSGVSFVTGNPADGMGPVWLFKPVPAGGAPVALTLDLNQVSLHHLTLQALNEKDGVHNGQYFGYVQGADGSFAGGPIGTDVWVPEGRYLFQAVTVGSNGAPTVNQYNLFSPVVNLPAELPADGRIRFGGSGQLTRLSVGLADSALSFPAVGAFRTDLAGVGSPRFASKPPLYVTPGTYSVEALVQRLDLMDNWAYWIAHAVTASGGESQSWQVDTNFTAQLSLERSVVEPDSLLNTTNLIQDSFGNRLVRVALNPQLGGVHLVPTGDPKLLAPFLVIKNSAGEEVYREKQLDALAADGRYYSAWGGCFTSNCPPVAPTTGPSSYFGQAVQVPGAWMGASYTAQIELGVGPQGPVYADPVSFTVSSAPVLDRLPAATREGEVTVSGTTQAGASVAVSYTLDGGAPQEAGVVTADSDGRFSLTVTLGAEGTYAFSAIATLDGKSSAPSLPVSVVSDRTAPGAPRSLAWSSPDLSHIKLTWEASADLDVTAYEIQRGGERIGEVKASDLLSFLDEGLAANTAYTYQIITIDWAGNRSAAAVANAATGEVADAIAPTAPANLQAALTEPSVAQLTWEAATDNVAVVGYRVYRSVDGGAPTLLATVTDGLSLVVPDLATATTYTFTVTAIDGGGNESAPSNTAEVTTAGMTIKDVQVRIRPLTRFGAALPGATVQIALNGEPKRQAEAVVLYQTWLDESGALLTAPRDLELTVPLTATAAAPGVYTGSTKLPAGASLVTKVVGRLADGLGHSVTAEPTAGLPLAIAGSLSVQLNVPEGATEADVAVALQEGAKLTLWSDSVASGGQLNPTGAGQYLLPDLTPADDYQLRLVTDRGWELARLSGIKVYGGFQNGLAVSPRLPATVQLQILDVDGQPKAARGTFRGPDGTDLNWSAGIDGKSQISGGRWAGDSITYKTWIGLPYVDGQSVTVKLNPGYNLVTLQLAKYPQGVLQGTVLRATDNTPIADATVTVFQKPNGYGWTATAKTDANGFYSLNVYAGEATVEAAIATGVARTLDPVTVTVPAGGTAQQDLLLRSRGFGTVTVDIYTREPGGEWQGPILLDWRQASHYHLSATTRNGTFYGYPIKPPAMDGETVKVCTKGQESKLPDQCAEAIFDSELKAHVEFRLDGANVSPIVLKAIDDLTGEPVTIKSGTLFPMASSTSNWRRPAVQLLTNGSTETRVLENGTYEVLLIGADGKVGTARFQSVLGESKEVEVRMKSGRFFQSQPDNSLFVSQAEVGLESYLTFRATFTNHGPAVKNAIFRMNAPGSETSIFMTLYATIDGQQTSANMTDSGNFEFWIGEIGAGQTRTATYTVRVNASYAASLLAVVSQASLMFTEGSNVYTETIGVATVPFNPVSIDVPSEVNQQQILVAGNASPVGGLLTVYDGEIALGTTTVAGAGKWSLPITLPGSVTKVRTHKLRVEVKDPVTGEVYSANTTVKYDPNAVIMESISLLRPADDGSMVGITINPSAVVPTFPFVLAPGKPVTVAIQFSDPNRVIDPTAEIPGMGKVSLQKGPDGLYRGEFATWSGSPGALFTSYQSQPLPFDQVEQPTLSDMRDSLPPALYNATVVSQSTGGNTTADPSSGGGWGSMILNLDGKEENQVSISLSISPVETNPDEVEKARMAAGGVPVWGVTLHHGTYGTSLTGYMAIGGSGGMNSFGPISLNPIFVGTKSFELTMKVLGPATDIAQLAVAPGSLDGIHSQFMSLYDMAENCGGWSAGRYEKRLKDLYEWYMEIQVMLGVANIMGIVFISSGVGTIAGATLSIALFALGYFADQQLADELERIRRDMENDRNCDSYKGNDDGPRRKAAKPKWIMDPGGYVYEAVPENRLSGVTTSLLEKQPDGSMLFWDSTWYGQENPLTTNAEGLYAWDVPEGDWQVVYQKDGYLTTTSPLLHVPPPQTEVNQGMISLAAPTVQTIKPGQDGAYLDLVFSQYMKAVSLTDATILVTLPDGTLVEGTITPLAPATADNDLLVTRTARFTPVQPLVVGAAYLVDVSALVQNYAGNTMMEGFLQEVVVPADVTAPGPLKGLTVTPADGALLLTWSNPADADFSHVRLAWSLTEYGDWVETSGERYAITGLANGVTYSIKLVTVDATGNESDPIVITGKPVDTTAPGEVTAVTVVPGAHQLTVIWDDPTEADLAKVRIDWTGSDGVTGSTQLPRGAQFFTLTGLADLVTYQFTLIAIDQVGNSAKAVTVSGTTPDVTAPGLVTEAQAMAGDTKVTLTWTDPTDADFAKVQITWQGGSAELAKGAQQYEVFGLTNGTVYEFQLVTVDEVGNASAPVTLSGRPVPPDVVVLDVTANQSPASFDSVDGVVSLQVMPKTFAGPVTVKVIRLGWPTWPATKALNPLTGAYALTSTGTPSRPITITLRYDKSLLGEGEFKQVALYRQDETDPTRWVLVGGSVNPGQGYVRAEVDRPGVYAVMLAQ